MDIRHTYFFKNCEICIGNMYSSVCLFIYILTFKFNILLNTVFLYYIACDYVYMKFYGQILYPALPIG
jgi:hypothetical protein